MKNSNKKEITSVWEFLNANAIGTKKEIFSLTIIVIIGLLLGQLTPIIYGKIIDSLTESRSETFRLLMIYLVVLFLVLACSLIENYFGNSLSAKLESRLKGKIFQKLLHSKYVLWDHMTLGELESRYHGDTGTCTSFYVDLVTSITSIAISIATSVWFALLISRGLSAVALVFFPLSLLITVLFRKRFKEMARKNKKYNDKVFENYNETVKGIVGIKAHRLESLFKKRNSEILEEGVALRKKNVILSSIFRGAQESVSSVFSISLIAVASYLITQGKLSIGNLVAFNMYIQRLYVAISDIQKINRNKQEVTVSISRLREILDAEEEHCNEVDDNRERPEHDIIIRDLLFGYDIDYVIKNISTIFGEKRLSVIVGENGCGKTTLFKILVSLYDNYTGEIIYDGMSIKQVSTRLLREKILYVGKERFFFNGTILDNIRMAEAGVTDEQIIQACQLMEIDQFITALPCGYKTKITSEGAIFSSGQAQRINFVRAYLSHAEVLLLDEITSDLDGNIEKKIVSLTKELSQRKTVICISHRLALIENADTVFYMIEGNMVASGTHKKLIKTNDRYRTMFY